MNRQQMDNCQRFVWMRVLVGVLACVCFFTSASGDETPIDIQRVYSEASLVWAEQLRQFLYEPSERHVAVTEDGVTRQVVWLNYADPPRRLIRSSSENAVHVYAVNGEYAFDITDVRNTGRFQLNDMGATAADAVILGSYESFFPQGTMIFNPVVALTRRDLIAISAVEKHAGLPDCLSITGKVMQSLEMDEEPYSLFGGSQWSAGTVLRICVDPAHEWRVVSADIEYPNGAHWTQINEYAADGRVRGEVSCRYDGELAREYSFEWEESPLRPLEESAFYLSHYGLSESTAGYLMGSRRYILVFCGLFFGAIFLRVLAWVLKRRRTKNSEATA